MEVMPTAPGVVTPALLGNASSGVAETSGPVAGPVTPPEAPQTPGSPGPAAVEQGAKDAEDADEGKPEVKKTSARARTSARGSTRRQHQRRPQPNLIQRIFGIRPK